MQVTTGTQILIHGDSCFLALGLCSRSETIQLHDKYADVATEAWRGFKAYRRARVKPRHRWIALHDLFDDCVHPRHLVYNIGHYREERLHDHVCISTNLLGCCELVTKSPVDKRVSYKGPDTVQAERSSMSPQPQWSWTNLSYGVISLSESGYLLRTWSKAPAGRCC